MPRDEWSGRRATDGATEPLGPQNAPLTARRFLAIRPEGGDDGPLPRLRLPRRKLRQRAGRPARRGGSRRWRAALAPAGAACPATDRHPAPRVPRRDRDRDRLAGIPGILVAQKE